MLDLPLDTDFLRNFVAERLSGLGEECHIKSFDRISKDSVTQDSSSAHCLTTGTSKFVLLVSPPAFAQAVGADVAKAADMRNCLGTLGFPVARPIDSGIAMGLSYALTPYWRPMARERQRGIWDQWRMKTPLLTWLSDIAREHKHVGDVSAYQAAFDALDGAVEAQSSTAHLLSEAKSRFEGGDFKPVHIPMHGDLWKGNILHGEANRPFTLIDWGGSELNGYPLYDLMRLALSFRISTSALRGELDRHRAALNCADADLPLFLLGALGHYAEKRGEFPLDRFREMADRVVMRFQEVRR
jgi:hypothetical protein